MTILVNLHPAAQAQEKGGLPALELRVLALENKTAPITLSEATADAPEVVFSGVNVRIVNGLGHTDTTNGRGNLIVGYNAVNANRPGRNGSHNLVVGDQHSYMSHSGLVVGVSNALVGPCAAVCGGFDNSAADHCCVLAGFDNSATEYGSIVAGGFNNRASGLFSCIWGGGNNQAVSQNASIIGGSGIREDRLDGWSAGNSEDATTLHGNFRSP